MSFSGTTFTFLACWLGFGTGSIESRQDGALTTELLSDTLKASSQVPHLQECPPLLRKLGSGWTSEVFESRIDDMEIAVKVYPMLNVTHYALTEIEIYQRLEPLWGICVPKLHFYGTCDTGPNSKPSFVLATTMLGKTFSNTDLSEVSEHLKLEAVDCMQRILLTARISRLDISLGNLLFTPDGSSVRWVDFAYSTLIESHMKLNDEMELQEAVNFLAVRYTNKVWEKLRLPADLDHPLKTRAATLFSSTNFQVQRTPSSIVWPILPDFDSLFRSLSYEPVSWISPRFVGLGSRYGKRVLVLLYGLDFAMFGHNELYNLLRLESFWGSCIPRVLEYGISGRSEDYEQRMVIIFDLPDTWTVQRSSPTILTEEQKLNAMRCLEEMHSTGFINGYVRALDIVTNSHDDRVLWYNFAFAVTDFSWYEPFEYMGMGDLVIPEQNDEIAYIRRALDDPQTQEIY